MAGIQDRERHRDPELWLEGVASRASPYGGRQAERVTPTSGIFGALLTLRDPRPQVALDVWDARPVTVMMTAPTMSPPPSRPAAVIRSDNRRAPRATATTGLT
jgi:hypothetical protein